MTKMSLKARLTPDEKAALSRYLDEVRAEALAEGEKKNAKP
jgi:hypothetical protein